jgi:hypothetical protein
VEEWVLQVWPLTLVLKLQRRRTAEQGRLAGNVLDFEVYMCSVNNVTLFNNDVTPELK